METNKNCGRCDQGLILERAWRAMTRDQKKTVRAAGLAPHRARGLCSPCYERIRRGVDEMMPDLQKIPGELVLLDWEWLHETGQLTKDQSMAERVRIAAPRIGMSVDALSNALLRAGVRNPVEPILPTQRSAA